jgi:hypothetical protein
MRLNSPRALALSLVNRHADVLKYDIFKLKTYTVHYSVMEYLIKINEDKQSPRHNLLWKVPHPNHYFPSIGLRHNVINTNDSTRSFKIS